jgi:hypothetical protein
MEADEGASSDESPENAVPAPDSDSEEEEGKFL